MQNKTKFLSILSLVIGLSCLLFLCFFHKTFWFDEAYCISMVKNLSFSEISNLTAHDVHPPLYFFILKSFCFFFGTSLVSMHLCSLLPIIFIILLAFFPIKRIFGTNTSYIFILLVALLPIILYYAIEIRMYSWLVFFVLATSVYSYDALFNNNKSSYVKFTFFAICAAYTHNYGLATSLSVYFISWLICIYQRKKNVHLLISTVCFLIIYGFWAPSLYFQLTLVKQDFWIPAMTLKNFISLPLYFLGYVTNSNRLLFIVLFIALGLMAYFSFKDKKNINKEKVLAACFFLAIFFIVYITTGLLSVLFRPILIDRYILSVLGCFILGIALLISSMNKTSNKINILGIISFICLVSIYCIKLYNEFKKYDSLNSKSELIANYFDTKIESTTDKYSIIGSINQNGILSILSIIKPENNYRFFYSKGDKAKIWLPPIFKIDDIYSLDKESDVIFIIRDLGDADHVQQLKESVDNLNNDLNSMYTFIEADTIDNIEMKKMHRKKC